MFKQGAFAARWFSSNNNLSTSSVVTRGVDSTLRAFQWGVRPKPKIKLRRCVKRGLGNPSPLENVKKDLTLTNKFVPHISRF